MDRPARVKSPSSCLTCPAQLFTLCQIKGAAVQQESDWLTKLVEQLGWQDRLSKMPNEADEGLLWHYTTIPVFREIAKHKVIHLNPLDRMNELAGGKVAILIFGPKYALAEWSPCQYHSRISEDRYLCLLSVRGERSAQSMACVRQWWTRCRNWIRADIAEERFSTEGNVEFISVRAGVDTTYVLREGRIRKGKGHERRRRYIRKANHPDSGGYEIRLGQNSHA